MISRAEMFQAQEAQMQMARHQQELIADEEDTDAALLLLLSPSTGCAAHPIDAGHDAPSAPLHAD